MRFWTKGRLKSVNISGSLTGELTHVHVVGSTSWKLLADIDTVQCKRLHLATRPMELITATPLQSMLCLLSRYHT
jgi:hypothetical protein